jgi:hypothetical protein
MSETAANASPTAEPTVDEIISDCGGDARAAIVELVAVIRSLILENKTLRAAASPGFARRRPIVFGCQPE